MSLAHHTHSISDERGGRDPTGLEDIRGAFRRETDQRWNRLRRDVKRGIVGKDLLKLGPDAPSLLQSSADKAHLFQRWLNERLLHTVAGNDGSWMRKHLSRAASRASARAGRLVGANSSLTSSSLPASHAASVSALAAICEGASNAARDAVHTGLLENPQSGKLAKSVDKALSRGHGRARQLAEHAATQAYTQATLDTLAAHGVSQVGSLSERQATRDAQALANLVAAGIMFVDPRGNGLFLHRTDGEGWAFPGGGVEGAETPEVAAVREGHEEVGGVPIGELKPLTTRQRNGVTFHTFRHDTAQQFTPSLNHEHDRYTWAPLNDPPEPLHPGVRWTLRQKGLLDYDENQPRDEHGRWTAGASGDQPNAKPAKLAGATASEPPPLDPMAKSAWILEKAKGAVSDAGYDPARVYLSMKPSKFKVGDKEYTTGGVAFTQADGQDGNGDEYKKGDIVIYGQPDFAHDFPVRGIAMHEAMHQKWEAVYDRYLDEWRAANDATKAANAKTPPGMQSSEAPLFASGELKPGFFAKYPVYGHLAPILEQHYADLINKDGVSQYSKSYWDDFDKAGGEVRKGFEVTGRGGKAVHETLAEIARIYDDSKTAKKPVLSELTGNRIDPIWDNFYNKVEGVWAKIVKPKSFAHAA